LKDLDVDGKKILKSTLKCQDKRAYVGLMWLMTFGVSIKNVGRFITSRRRVLVTPQTW